MIILLVVCKPPSKNSPLAQIDMAVYSGAMLHLTGISLQSFRNYALQTVQFTGKNTLIAGPNAVGKTTILEAISLLSNGESFRAEDTEEMIQLGSEYGRVQGRVNNNDEIVTLEVLLTRGVVQGKKTQKRLYSVNNVRRQKRVFLGNLPSIVFRPEDLRLIEGSPSRRRQFLDNMLAQSDRQYAASLKTYEEALRRRNRFLHDVREGLQPRSVLSYWTQTILKHGEILQDARQKWVNLTEEVPFPLLFSLEYQPSVISEERLAQYADAEVAAGHTLVGPHKDDIIVKLPVGKSVEPMPVAAFGSRGQQRMGVLWLKTVEFGWLQKSFGAPPLLLLDDIFSELDVEHRQQVTQLLTEGQVIITTADPASQAEIEQWTGSLSVVSLESTHE